MSERMMLPAVVTFVAAIMVASATLAVVTTIHLRDTQRKLEVARTDINTQRNQMGKLASIVIAQQDLLSSQQGLLGKMVTNEKHMYRVLFKTVR